MNSGVVLLMKSIINQLSDAELGELSKPIDDVDLENLPTIRRIFGMDDNDTVNLQNELKDKLAEFHKGQ